MNNLIKYNDGDIELAVSFEKKTEISSPSTA